jgi:hypothetical protein
MAATIGITESTIFTAAGTAVQFHATRTTAPMPATITASHVSTAKACCAAVSGVS